MAIAMSVMRSMLNRYAHISPSGMNHALCFHGPRAMSMMMIQMNDCLSPVHPHTMRVPVPVLNRMRLGS